jgi:hypothetical protein
LILSQAQASPGEPLSTEQSWSALEPLDGQRFPVLIPDRTLPQFFRMPLEGTAKLDFRVELEILPPLDAAQLHKPVGIGGGAQATAYSQGGILNHARRDPSVLLRRAGETLYRVKEPM